MCADRSSFDHNSDTRAAPAQGRYLQYDHSCYGVFTKFDIWSQDILTCPFGITALSEKSASNTLPFQESEECCSSGSIEALSTRTNSPLLTSALCLRVCI